MKNKTLLILAAGMGSRFGGLKQVEKFGPTGEFIIDYSIFDAIKNGFNKVIFVIKEENFELFKSTVGKRIEEHVKVEYVFQSYDDVPSKYTIPETRVKPLGTAHAILCSKHVINEPFVIINSDDFYGNDAFKVASEFIDTNPNDVGIVGYKVVNTLTEHGSVKRGVLTTNNGLLTGLIESKVEKVNNELIANPLDGRSPFKVTDNDLVSMNMIVFPTSFINYIDEKFDSFLSSNDLSTAEFLIPDVVSESIVENRYKVIVEKTNAKWVGVT